MSKFLKYSAGGTLVYWIEILLTVTITELTNVWFMYAFLISLMIGLFLLYFYHKYVTFEFHVHKDYQFLLVFLVTLFIYAGWYTVSYFGHIYISTHYLAVVILSSAPFSLLGYCINKNYIFKDNNQPVCK